MTGLPRSARRRTVRDRFWSRHDDPDACGTLRRNRGAEWKIIQGDVHDLDGRPVAGIDLFAAGLPCPPFSVAGKQLGDADDRDLFPQALRLIRQAGPRAVLLENVPGLAGRRFGGYRAQVPECLHDLGYRTWWELVQASTHGVPQLRPRLVLVAIKDPWAARFGWPAPSERPPPTAGEAVHDLMSSRGWPGASAWRDSAGGHRADHRRRQHQTRRPRSWPDPGPPGVEETAGRRAGHRR